MAEGSPPCRLKRRPERHLPAHNVATGHGPVMAQPCALRLDAGGTLCRIGKLAHGRMNRMPADSQTTAPLPDGLVCDDEDNFCYFKDPDGSNGPLVIFPCSFKGQVVLDGAFTPKQLRAVADWVEAALKRGGYRIVEFREVP